MVDEEEPEPIEEMETAEPLEEAIPEGEEGMAGAEFTPDASVAPKSNVYSLLLILTFTAFLTGIILAGRELWEFYDVQFWIFSKQ